MQLLARHLTRGWVSADKIGMRQRTALSEVLDKHPAVCPRCACPEAIVLLDPKFKVHWQCVDCEHSWPASEEESDLLLSATLKTVH